jgi:hypothetical protein
MRSRYRFLTALRQLPENRTVPFHRSASPLLSRLPEHVPVLAPLERRVRAGVAMRDLERLHGVLEGSPLAGRYWLWGGVVLGWAREGRILVHDQKDVDIAYEAGDEDRFAASRPALVEAGFQPWFRYQSNEGVITETTFVRHGAKYEFWRMERVGEELEYHVYGCDLEGQPVQIRSRVPWQPLECFDFAGSQWLKTLDHDRELTILYGDWRTPDPAWDYVEQAGLLGRAVWNGGR